MRPKLYRSVNLAMLVGLCLMAIAGSPAAGAASAAPAGLNMKIEPYWQGHFKFGEWLPLHVTLANDGPPVRAEVRADTTEAGGQTTFVAPVELPTGARKRLTLYVLPPSFAQAIRVRLVDGTRELDSQSVPVTVERNIHYLIGVIAPRTEPFAVLAGLTLNSQNSVDAEFAFKGGPAPQMSRPVRVIPIPFSDIPDRPEGLRALDALVISGVDSSSLTPEQAGAVQGWVSAGGRLILGGGAAASRALAGLPDAMVSDFRPAGSTADLQSLDALGRFAAQDVRVPGPFAVAWPRADSSGVLVEQDGRALVVDKRWGSGHLTFVGLDLAAGPFDAWAGTLRFWEKLITPDSAYPSNAPPDIAPRMMRATSLSSALQNLPALELPSIRWLGALIAIYIVLVGPANYLVLRRLHKLDWGWFTIGGLTLLFSAGAFGLGVNMRGGDIILNKISVIVFNGRTPAGPVESYVGVFSPARHAYTVAVPGHALISPITVEGSPWGPGGAVGGLGTVDITQGEPGQVRGIQLNQWSMQGFQTESPAPEGWQLESDLQFDGSRVWGTIANRTNEPLQDAVIVNGNRMIRVGDLLPGQSQRVDGTLQGGSAPFPYMIFESAMQNPGPAGPPRDVQTKQQLLYSYFGNVKGSPQTPNRPMLIGWMRSSPLEVEVAGTRWNKQEISLVLATLDIRYPSGPVRLAAGNLFATLAGMQGEGGVCGPSPNQIYLSRGTATLEFQLPDEFAGMSIKRMAVVIHNAFGSGIEVYDRQGSWIKLDAPMEGNNELAEPARFLLSNAAVLVRLTANAANSGCGQYDLEIEGEK